MTAEDYIDGILEKEENPLGYIKEDDAYEAVDLAKRDIAWRIHIMIHEGKDLSAIDKYVTDICDF